MFSKRDFGISWLGGAGGEKKRNRAPSLACAPRSRRDAFIPGKAASDFRMGRLDVLRRYFAGDTTLSAEIAAKRPSPEFLLPVRKKQALFDKLEIQFLYLGGGER